MTNQEFRMFCPGFCSVLLGYPRPMLHEKCFNVQWKIKKLPMVSPGFCSVLLGDPLAILHGTCFNDQWKFWNFQCFLWIPQRFARLPPSNLAWKMLQFAMEKRKLWMFFPGYFNVLLGYSIKNVSIFNEKYRNPNALFWFLQHFARLRPSNFAWKTHEFIAK